MIRFYLYALSSILVITTKISAQVAWIEPADATVDSMVTLYFDATRGDQGLMGYSGDVYAHTGVITLESANNSDWKHVVADWGTADDSVLMQQVGTDLYAMTIHIQSFYSIDSTETVLKLAFVFRNADGSVTGRSVDGSDIFVPIQHQNAWIYQTFSHSVDGLTIHTSGGDLLFRPYEGALETEILPEGQTASESYAIIAEPLNEEWSVDTTPEWIHAAWNEWNLSIEKSSLHIYYMNGDTLTRLTDFITGGAQQGGILTFDLQEQIPVYGGGSRALPFDLRGYDLEFYNQAQYGYSNQTPNLNISIPLLMQPGSYALFLDNHHRAGGDIGKEEAGKLTYDVGKGTLRYWMMASDSLPQTSKTIADLTGFAPMPPMWGMGYIQSRYGYETQSEAEQVVQEMRSHDFPLDALVLDLYWFGGTSHMGDFNWDTGRFPDPSGMMQDFNDQGVETILITEPYFTLQSDLYDAIAANQHFAENESGDPYVLYGFWAGDASLFDMSSPEARSWLWPHYKALFDMGVSGLWTDLGEPETHPQDMQHEFGSVDDVHNIYNNLWAQMLFDSTKQTYPEKRLFNLTRSGYAGMQRYGTYPWSGDIQRSFSGLKAQIPIMLHMSMSGVGYMHSDLGGFTGGGQDPELYTRWLQLGTFSPVMRAHGTGVPPEPYYYNQTTQDRVRKTIEMRYDFLPYNYTLAWEYSTKGMPLARPMDSYEPVSTQLNGVSDQYFWGEDLIVAPVVNQGATSRLVTLPKGMWADYQTGKLLQRGQTVTASASMEEIPLFIREGGFLVQSMENLQHTKEYDSDSIRIRHLVHTDGQSSSALWYHDDGVTAGNHLENRYNLMKLTGATEGLISSITLKKQVSNLESPERWIELMVYGLDHQPRSVTLNDREISVYSNRDSYEQTTPAAFWEAPFLYVDMLWKDTLTQVEINQQEPTSIARQHTGQQLKLLASPNPFVQNTHIEAWVDQAGSYRLELITIGGMRYGSAQVQWSAGRNEMPLTGILCNDTELPAGVYVLILTGNQEQTQLKLVKMQR